jgi:sulfide:quinone oxidoreductase
MAHQLKAQGLTDTAKLTFITPERCLSHSASSTLERGALTTEELFEQLGIHAITNAAVRKVTQNEIHLVDGHTLPFAFAMLVPPFLGVDPVRACVSITDACGFVVVNDYYQTLVYPEVFAAGVAVAVASPNSSLPHTVAKTGHLSEEMARVAARNVAAQIRGTAMLARPASSIEAKCILDAENSYIRSLTGDPGVARS